MKAALRAAGLKLIEEAVSVKVHFIALATVLLAKGLIDSTAWLTVMTSIGLGRVLIESIVAHKGKNEESSPNL